MQMASQQPLRYSKSSNDGLTTTSWTVLKQLIFNLKKFKIASQQPLRDSKSSNDGVTTTSWTVLKP